MDKIAAVILAAGEGKRMKSQLPKVLHALCGFTMIEHVLRAAVEITDEVIVVVGHGADKVKESLGDSVSYAYQEQQLGTGHALMQAIDFLPEDGAVLVLCGDTPLLTADVLQSMLEKHLEQKASATVLTTFVSNPTGYGRIIRRNKGELQRIVEDRDATDGERKINEINTGTYIFNTSCLIKALMQLKNKNIQGEYYLTDCLELLISEGLTVSSHRLDDCSLAVGINDRTQLASATALLQERTNLSLMSSGVTIVDPRSTYIDVDVKVGPDTTLLPGTLLKGKTMVGEKCTLGPFTEINNSLIGNQVLVRHSVITGCIIEDGVVVGPFAHLRPQTILRQGVKVGDFVEIKKSDIGPGSKVPHLSYVGDARIGSGVNLGAGTIVVNFDGRQKHTTQIDNEAFIGCNSNLVAPLKIGKGAFIAAGSTITKDIPDGALSLARGRQVNKEGLAKRYLNRD